MAMASQQQRVKMINLLQIFRFDKLSFDADKLLVLLFAADYRQKSLIGCFGCQDILYF